jgi:hypothetical protein
VAQLLTDKQLLEHLTEEPWFSRLGEKQQEIFVEWQASGKLLTDKMREWIRDAADRVGLQVAPSKNLFSAMSPEKQRAERERAKRVKLPWE